jgi:hypothetical protein
MYFPFQKQQAKILLDELTAKNSEIDSTIQLGSMAQKSKNFPTLHTGIKHLLGDYDIVSVDHISIPDSPFDKIAMVHCGIAGYDDYIDMGGSLNYVPECIVIPVPLKFIRDQRLDIEALLTCLRKITSLGIELKVFKSLKLKDNQFWTAIDQPSAELEFIDKFNFFYTNIPKNICKFSRYADIGRPTLGEYLDKLNHIIEQQQKFQKLYMSRFGHLKPRQQGTDQPLRSAIEHVPKMNDDVFKMLHQLTLQRPYSKSFVLMNDLKRNQELLSRAQTQQQKQELRKRIQLIKMSLEKYSQQSGGSAL